MTGTDRRTLDRIAAHDPAAELAQTDGRWVLTMTREFTRPPADVWPWLIDPERLRRWSPVVPDRPLDAIGPATCRETPDAPVSAADVLVADPPCELVHRWSDHLLRWTLTPTAGGTRLQLEHTFTERSDASSYGAGWHLCLATLEAVEAGEDVESLVGDRAVDYGWPALRDAYDAAFDAGFGA